MSKKWRYIPLCVCECVMKLENGNEWRENIVEMIEIMEV